MNNITLTIELGPETQAKLDKILAALPATTPDRVKPSRSKKNGKGDKLTDQELANLFQYCSKLARMVSPRDAMKYFGFTFDGAVGDTLEGLAQLYANELSIDDNGNTGDAFKRDELYGPTLRQMMYDIGQLLDGYANI